ncbi:RidA family protein [Streptomyces coelicoflavus]|nr:RidA family protein [Streptomyces coelicoflavus]
MIENIRDMLAEVGAELHDIAQATSYLMSMNDLGGHDEPAPPRPRRRAGA